MDAAFAFAVASLASSLSLSVSNTTVVNSAADTSVASSGGEGGATSLRFAGLGEVEVGLDCSIGRVLLSCFVILLETEDAEADGLGRLCFCAAGLASLCSSVTADVDATA
jgi:hypothetical protein